MLRAFENKVLRRIFGRTRGISGDWRKLTNNINVKIKEYEMGGHGAELKNHIYANYLYFNKKILNNIPFAKDWCIWKTILKRIFTEAGDKDVD